MRDLQKTARECMAKLDALGIKCGKVVEFRINSRAVTRLGSCKKTKNGFVIEVAASLTDERVDLKQGLEATLMHELLHTCYGCMNHGKRWHDYAARVNAAYGYNVSTTTSRAELPIPSDLRPKPNYIVKCSSCGEEITRQRRSPLVEHPERYRCGKCGGILKAYYVIGKNS